MTQSDNRTPETGAKKSFLTPKRVGWIALNVVLPAWEVSSVTRHAGRNVSRLWQRIRDVTAGRGAGDYRPADWSQAVADSGMTPARLVRNFRVSRWIWWGLMWLTGLPAAGFLLMLTAAGSSVSGTGWLRVGCVVLVLLLLAATGFVQALKVSYRLWQLTEKRVSASEEGSFQAYLQETRWCRQVLSGGLL
ncbi:conjugal transfer protein TraX [Serratia sp. PF2-63]|uniref:conjugal transfer protein TraX n=1 Tax=Enterobacterales TaxID=91347 RepID=UPI0024B5AE7D|nr:MULTISPECIES: conjugal transfer protein TraX [Enterobacterales]MDI9223657.1 conjugal transfer protein TraX [Pantoea sp. EA-12]MDI9265871.1 conjugal transfer protein TraX [Serratia sp. PF2-63]MDI9267161.1 conjugal transfer protein TraX [Serratia sp. PF-27]